MAGDADSQCRLGSIYLDGGEGLPADQAMAYLWLSRAAAQGLKQAWRLIGERIDPVCAGSTAGIARWIELAAADGGAAAQAKLGRMLLRQEHAQPAPERTVSERATALLRSAVLQGCEDACFDLGAHLLATARGGADRAAEACRHLERAYQRGQTAAARLLADHYWDGRDPDRALAWYGRCKKPADPEVWYRMGVLHTLQGLPAAGLLERAAKSGHLLACEELGAQLAAGLLGGTGVRPANRRLKAAAHWLERAAALGSVKACHLLGLLYEHPKSSVHSRRDAERWHWEAACRGHAGAALRLGLQILRTGRLRGRYFSSPEDAEIAAVRFLALAARDGSAEAKNALHGLSGFRPGVAVGEADWAGAIGAASRNDRNLALRLRLGRSLCLSTQELLLVDPCAADRGDCFVVDLGPARRRRRIVCVDTQEQRDLIEEAKRCLGGEMASAVDWRTAYRARYGRLRRLCREAGAGSGLFPRARPERLRIRNVAST